MRHNASSSAFCSLTLRREPCATPATPPMLHLVEECWRAVGVIGRVIKFGGVSRVVRRRSRTAWRLLRMISAHATCGRTSEGSSAGRVCAQQQSRKASQICRPDDCALTERGEETMPTRR
jgi:hypothetical protein